MHGYFKTAKKGTKKINKTAYSSDSSISSSSRHRRSTHKNRTTRKAMKSGTGVRLKKNNNSKVSSSIV